MWLFVNCLIENPTFDSQTKENMTLQQKSFGSTCPLSDKFIKQVLIDWDCSGIDWLRCNQFCLKAPCLLLLLGHRLWDC